MPVAMLSQIRRHTDHTEVCIHLRNVGMVSTLSDDICTPVLQECQMRQINTVLTAGAEI